MGVRDDLLQEVFFFLKKWKMDKSTFGCLCNGNPKFVHEIEKRDARSSTLDKASEFMKAYEKARALSEKNKGRP